MNAPATEQPPVEERPTQPLPLEQDRITERSWLMSEAAEVLIPVTILAAIGAGAVIREALTVDGRFVLAVLALGGVLLVCALVYLLPRLLMRDDGQHSGLEREH
jgi:hypothetical protein